MTDGTMWTAKEVFADLKKDILHRFDQQDVTLGEINRRLNSTATKQDVDGLRQEHNALDGRVTVLEKDVASDGAVRLHKRDAWKIIGYTALVLATVGGTIAAIVTLIVH